MGQKVGKRMNDGNRTGLKQDKFRNSSFEYESSPDYNERYGGVTHANLNTIGGAWAENRGHRDDQISQGENPFENGKLHNWNHRQGWDEYFGPRNSETRGHGGNLRHNDFGALRDGYRGVGPRGYARSDSRIQDDACELLTRDRHIDASDVDVTVESGVVTLTGKVEDRSMKRYAGQIIDNISGVKDVNNLLEFDRK